MESISKVTIMAEKYQSILERTEGMTFPWVVAVRLVGGKKRLERLMAEQKVRFDKPFGAQNTHWQFVATDILSNVKPLSVRKALNYVND